MRTETGRQYVYDMFCLNFRSRTFVSKFKGPSLLLNCKNCFSAGYYVLSFLCAHFRWLCFSPGAGANNTLDSWRVTWGWNNIFFLLKFVSFWNRTMTIWETGNSIDMSFSNGRDASNRMIARNSKKSRNCRYASNTKKFQQQPVGQPQQRG